jgi:hypothetical protein
MDLNTLAKLVTEAEGKKKAISIAQVKEVLACVNTVLKNYGVNFYAIVKKAK